MANRRYISTLVRAEGGPHFRITTLKGTIRKKNARDVIAAAEFFLGDRWFIKLFRKFTRISLHNNIFTSNILLRFWRPLFVVS
jgi:hypothetical protein